MAALAQAIIDIWV